VSVFIGCAGWSIPAFHASRFPADGSHLVRYASLFNAVEINSSFYRSHQKQTYRKWAATAPDHFRFSVKVPKQITHERRLVGVEELLGQFVDEVQELGDKLGPLLVQLPPSLAWHAPVAISFFRALRERSSNPVACEPRHASWFTAEVDRELEGLQIARVAADPSILPEASAPGGYRGLSYFRLHGSPRMYYSAYNDDQLCALSKRIGQPAAHNSTTWCIFDNTAAGAAVENALRLRDLV
jgi:uncharacterized protein YecE (DUF72 family)